MNELMLKQDLEELTGKKRRAQQVVELEQMGIPFKVQGERLLVSRHHVRRWLAGEELRTPTGPRLDLIR